MQLKINTASNKKIYRYCCCIFLRIDIYLYSIDIIDANRSQKEKYNYFIMKNVIRINWRIYFLFYTSRQISKKRSCSFIYIKIKLILQQWSEY